MSNRHRTVYYIGVTAGLIARASQHRHGEGYTFAKKYRCTNLIYYEAYGRIEEAIDREKVLKKWRRSWKDELIKKKNPALRDLYPEVAKH